MSAISTVGGHTGRLDNARPVRHRELSKATSAATLLPGRFWVGSIISTIWPHDHPDEHFAPYRQYYCNAGAWWAPSHLQSGRMINRMGILRPTAAMPAAAECSTDGGEQDSRLRHGSATSQATPANATAVRPSPACGAHDDVIRDFATQFAPDEVFGSDRVDALWSSPAGGSCRYGPFPLAGGNAAAIFAFCSSVAPRADSSSWA